MVLEQSTGGWRAEGTREQLLAAGLCVPAHFPQGRRSNSSGWDRITSKWLWDMHKVAGCDRWALCWPHTAEEAKQFNAATKRRKLQAELASEIAAGPEAWREYSANVLVSNFMQGIRAALATRAPYRLSDANLAAYDALARRLQILVLNAEVQRTDTLPDDHCEAMPPKLRAPLTLVKSSARA